MISMAADYPDRVAGVVYGRDTVVRRLREVGCAVPRRPARPRPTIAPWRADGATGSARPPAAPGRARWPCSR